MKVCEYACEYACKYVLCMDMIEFVYTCSFIDVCIYHLFTLPFQNPFFVNSSSSCLTIVNVDHKRDS